MRLVLPLLLIAAPVLAQDGSIVRRIGMLLEKEGNRSASDQELRKELLAPGGSGPEGEIGNDRGRKERAIGHQGV